MTIRKDNYMETRTRAVKQQVVVFNIVDCRLQPVEVLCKISETTLEDVYT